MDIYVTSSKNLVEYSNLKVASIKVKGEMDANYNISGNGKFKFIYSDKNKDGEMNNLPSNSNEEFKFIKASNVPDKDDNSGQDEEKPGNDNNDLGQDGEKPGNDNNLGQGEEKPENDYNQDKEENSTDSNEGSNESLENDDSNDDSNNKEDASSNEVETSDNLLRNIFIALIVLSGGVILIYNFKKRKA